MYLCVFILVFVLIYIILIFYYFVLLYFVLFSIYHLINVHKLFSTNVYCNFLVYVKLFTVECRSTLLGLVRFHFLLYQIFYKRVYRVFYIMQTNRDYTLILMVPIQILKLLLHLFLIYIN